jgi:hypothetical protein
VLAEAGLHPQAVTLLQTTQEHIDRAAAYHRPPQSIIDEALRAQESARQELVGSN